ncbi:hypothetical protein CYY_005962 [Polysphondylium violaceum]|uniref:Translation machinery-associated protein 16 n=1 Tax=Polysphondylium violaceum TaxID=133409 RepID=A0A8J4URT8_9MYCE|nr:hypothetical protein CYY_005962 [Polysphondylium violaceum]
MVGPNKKKANNNNNKVEKKALHPLSRKAQKLTQSGIRDVKKQTQKVNKEKELKPLKKKLDWFREKCADKKVFSEQDMSDLVQEYLKLLEPKDLDKAAKSSSADFVRNAYLKEVESFNTTGYLAPDLTSGPNVRALIDWDGEMKYADSVKLKKFKFIQPTTTESKME